MMYAVDMWLVVPIKFWCWSDRIDVRNVLLTYEFNAKAMSLKRVLGVEPDLSWITLFISINKEIGFKRSSGAHVVR